MFATRGRGGGTFVSDPQPPGDPPSERDARRSGARPATSGSPSSSAWRCSPPSAPSRADLRRARRRSSPRWMRRSRTSPPTARPTSACTSASPRRPARRGSCAAMTEVQGAMTDLIAYIAHPPEVLASSNAQHRRLLAAVARARRDARGARHDRAPAGHRAHPRRAAARRLTGRAPTASGDCRPTLRRFWPDALDFRPRSSVLSRSKDGRPNLFLRGGERMSTAGTLSADEQRLAELGYKQELHRGWSGVLQLRDLVLDHLGARGLLHDLRAGAGRTAARSRSRSRWPLISVLILTVAFSMSELASAYPTAGGIYYWASKLGGAGWGWFTGWFNLIGLVAVVASVDYVCATFLMNLLGLYNVHFIFNFRRPWRHGRPLQRPRQLRPVRRHPARPRADQRLLEPPRVAVQQHLGVVARDRRRGDRRDPDRRAQPPREPLLRVRPPGQQLGLQRDSMYWFYVLPLGFLLTMYTITGYDASAHVSEETHGAATVRAEGRLALGVLLGGDRLDRAARDHVRDPEAHGTPRSTRPASPRWRSSRRALSSAAAKAVILISTVGQLFCGMACVTSASRMTFAFSRDGAVPGHNLWRRLGHEPHADVGGALRRACSR